MLIKETRLDPFGLLIEPVQPGLDVRELNIAHLRELFHREQLLVLRGFRTFDLSVEFSDYCGNWGEVSVWPFGKVLELIERENPEDHIFDNSYVPMHWDGMYRPMVPEFQIFHCVKAPLQGQGGRTTFTNTLHMLKNASAEERSAWGKVTGTYQRKMEFYNSRTVSPVIVKHPYKDIEVIRYNEIPSGDFVNPPDLSFTDDSVHESLKAALYSPKNFYAHEWRTNDLVIADNFTLLHGREAFASKAPRHLQRVHVLSETPFKNPGLESYQ